MDMDTKGILNKSDEPIMVEFLNTNGKQTDSVDVAPGAYRSLADVPPGTTAFRIDGRIMPVSRVTGTFKYKSREQRHNVAGSATPRRSKANKVGAPSAPRKACRDGDSCPRRGCSFHHPSGEERDGLKTCATGAGATTPQRVKKSQQRAPDAPRKAPRPTAAPPAAEDTVRVPRAEWEAVLAQLAEQKAQLAYLMSRDEQRIADHVLTCWGNEEGGDCFDAAISKALSLPARPATEE